MSLEVAGVASFAYGQGKVYFVDQETLCTSTGNGLVAYSVGKLEQQRHVWGDESRHGASLGPFALGCSPTGGVSAFAPKDYPGDVTIAKGPSFAPVKKLKVGAELGYREVAVSRCRSRVAVVTGLPHFKLTLWDWEEEKMVAEFAAGEAFSGSGLSFFPSTPSVVVTMGVRKAVVLRVDLTTSAPAVIKAEVDLSVLSSEEKITGHAWTEARELYIGTSYGRLLRVAGAAPDPSPAPQWGQGRGPALVAAAVSLPRTAVLGKKVRVAGVVATKHHIIVAYAQEEGKGVVIWYNRHISAISASSAMAVSHVCQLDEAELCWLTVDPEYRNLVVGSFSGSLSLIQVDINGTAEGSKLSTRVVKVGHFFGGPVSGVCGLSEHMTASAADDGTVQLWRHREVDGDVYSQLLATWNLAEAATACHGSLEAPIVAVGTEGGVLQILDAGAAAQMEPGEEPPHATTNSGISTTTTTPLRPGEPDPHAQAVLFSSRLHSAPIVGVAVSPDGYRVASLGKNGTVAVLQRDRDSNALYFQVSCLTEVLDAAGPLAWAPALPNRPLGLRLALAGRGGDLTLITPPILRPDRSPVATDDGVGLTQSAAKLGHQVIRTQSALLALHAVLAEGDSGDIWVYAASADRSLRRFRVTAASADARRATNSYLLPEIDKPRELPSRPTSVALAGDGRTMAVTTACGSLIVYTVPLLEQGGRWALHDPAKGGATGCALTTTEEGETVAVVGGGDAVLHALELSTRQVRAPRRSMFPGSKLGSDTGGELVLTGPGGGPPVLGGFSSIIANAPFVELISCAAEAASFAQAYKTQQIKLAMDQSSSLHSEMRGRIRRLREDFRACIRENEMADKDEKLPRQEFVVDRDLRNILLTEGHERIKNVQRELRMGMAKEMLLYERLQATCASDAAEVYTRLHAIGAEGTFSPGSATAPPPPPPPRSSTLDNFPLRKLPTSEQRKVACVKFLRQVEVAEWEKRPAKYRGHVAIVGYQTESGGGAVPSEESEEMLPEEASVAGNNPPAASKSASAAAAAINAPDDALVCDKHHAVGAGPDRLLYKEMALHCPLRKRAQLLLLDQTTVAQKKEFNAKFKVLLQAKHDAISKIEEQQARIVEILKELEMEETPFTVHFAADEEPERLLEVKDEDVKVSKFVSAEEQAKLDAKAAAHAAAVEAAAKDSANARALAMMMHGTLEKREDKKVTLRREAWMDEVPAAEMSKEQRAALKEFERRQAELEEEYERHRRGLEAEKKTLEADVDRIIVGFNDQLSDLFAKRVALDMELQTVELQIARLASALEETEYSAAQSARIAAETEVQRALLPKRQAMVTELQRMVMRQRATVDSLSAEDKLIDKAFRKEFLSVELEEHQDLLTKMFKDRRRALFSGGGEVKRGTDLLGQKSSRALQATSNSSRARSPGSTRRLAPGGGNGTTSSRRNLGGGSPKTQSLAEGDDDAEATDPFSGDLGYDEGGEGGLPDSQQRPAFKAEDWPENVSQELFTRMMELRDAKVMTERELSSASARLTRLSALVEAGQEDEAATSGEMERLSREATDLGLEVECHAINLSMKYTLKMGQIEIPDQAVVPDFADSCLMGRQTVEVLNGEVVARSSHKIDRMREISGSRGELTTTAWESGALDLRAEHKLQHISELQLLHVTREIQNFMQDPERALAYNREVQLQNQLVANEKAHRLKMALLRKRVGSYEEAAEEQELENGYLRENMAKASAALCERERMNEALVDADNTPAKQRARTFRNIVTNQKLLDISRSQMEELHFLANELHRLKQRSYPAFTVPSHDPAALDRLRPGTTGHDLPGAGKYSRRPLSGTSNMRDRPRSTSARVRPPPSTALYATGTSRPGSQQATRVPSAGQRIGSSLPPTPPSRAGSRRPPAAAPPSQ